MNEYEIKKNAEDIAILQKYREQVSAFRRFCIQYGSLDIFEEEDFNAIALGFFAASLDDPEAIFHLALICRYDFQYWEGQTLGEWASEPLYFTKDGTGRVVVEDEAGNKVAIQE